MITPRNKLLFWFALIILPFMIIGAIFTAAEESSYGIIALFVFLAAIDATLAKLRFTGISVEFPPIVRLSSQKKGAIEFKIRTSRAKAIMIRLGLAFPEELSVENEYFLARITAENELSLFSWPCTGQRRGNFKLKQCYMEVSSPFGLWSCRKAQSINMEVRVYPNLARERKSLAALFLNRGMFGIHAQRQVGQGREFEKLREYVYGDSYDYIHWKATARRGRPVTKVFQVEKTQEVYIVLDASRLSARNANNLTAQHRMADDIYPATMLERFITASLITGLVAEKQGDIFGLLAFNDRVRSFVKAKNGAAHFNVYRDSLYNLQSQIVNPDFDDLFMFIGQKLRRRALLIFLTSLDDPVLAESFIKNVELISRKHLILVNMMKPRGIKNLFSPPAVDSLDAIYQDLGGHIMLHNLLEIKKVLRLRGINFSILENENMCTQIVSQYINVKQRQLI
ncbi:MAG TPA: DUF58 domain-containing protein [Smithella sp.]|nr:DUF58 domain-containing protein [Smithella sp.]